jgi:hypothetical protein
MNNKNIFLGVVAVVVVLGAVYILGLSKKTENGKDQDFDRKIDGENSEVVLESPREGELITSPFVVRGKARGSWFFEANIGVRLFDANGKLILAHYGMTNEDWMTTEFVPFSSSLSFGPPETETGTLVIAKDNPSGLPEHDASYSIPVRFVTATSSVSVYFGKYGTDSSMSACTNLESVERIIQKTPQIARAAILELLMGPNVDEEKAGLFTSIPSGVILKNITIENGTARADFNESLNAGGSCRVAAIRAQIERTLRQFPTVSDVIISVNGNSEEALQP